MRRLKQGSIAASFLALGLAISLGYLVYGYFRSVLMPELLALNLIAIAAVVGLASFFNPCSFPMLPSMIAYLHSRRLEGGPKALPYNARAALGIAAFNLMLGSAIGLLGEAARAIGPTIMPSIGFQAFRLSVGLALLLFGSMHLAGLSPSFLHSLGSRLSPKQAIIGYKGAYLYGFTHTAVGIGCGFPLMAIMVSIALSLGGFIGAIIAFSIYTLVMCTMVLMLPTLASSIRPANPIRMRKATGLVFLASGILFLLVSLEPSLSQLLRDIPTMPFSG